MWLFQSDATVETVPYISPSFSKVGVYLSEHFDDPSSLDKKWIKSNSKKPDVDEELAQYDGKLLITLVFFFNIIIYFIQYAPKLHKITFIFSA